MVNVSFDFYQTLAIYQDGRWTPNQPIVDRLVEYTNEGGNCFVIVSLIPTKSQIDYIAKFLYENGLDHYVSKIAFVGDKPKGKMCKHLNVKIHYDDIQSHLESCREEGIVAINASVLPISAWGE